MSKRILFIGEDQALWADFLAQAGAQAVSDPDHQWQGEFAGTEPEALAWIAEYDFDAVVADIQIPETNGVDLLDEIMRRQPKAIRVVLSDLADSQSTLQCIARAHRHLFKPCDASTLLSALNQAIELQTWLPSAAVHQLMPQMRHVPSPPTIYFRVIEEMQSSDISVEKIGDLIAQDPAITAKVLQLANSAVFGLQLQVIQPVEAVAYIGLETTKSLLLLVHSFSAFEKLQPAGFSVESLWRHSLATGHLARTIAHAEQGGADLAEQAFAAGLLHDLGKLLFAANVPDSFAQAVTLAREKPCHLWEAENQVFGACHAEIGACLLGVWGLPLPIVEAVALHHFPARRSERAFSALAAVHAANVLEHEIQADPTDIVRPEFDLAHLGELGLEARVEEWRTACVSALTEPTA